MAAKVKIYTKNWCWYCRAARKLLDQKGVDYEEIDVTGDRETRVWLAEVSGQTTVPQVFIDDKSYGGFSDISALDKRGALDPLLKG